MHVIEVKGINTFLVKASKLLLSEGIKRKVNNSICFEIPEPVCFKILNPAARWVIIPERKWNIFLAYAESLWIASGRNDLQLLSHYLKNMVNFSDNSKTLRGGYGPRIRAYNANSEDYCIEDFPNTILKYSKDSVDQLRFVEECFKEDEHTRRAIVQIGDPVKDCFANNGKKKITKDLPCTRTLHFMKDTNNNKLNLIVHMRSNDLLWGASAVNIFNFTFMQEYMASVLGLELGHYYHIVDNFHFYNKFKTKINSFAQYENVEDPSFEYNCTWSNLQEFNSKLKSLSNWEENLRCHRDMELIDFKDDFFNDWAKILFLFNTKKKTLFTNPILNTITK